MLNLEKQSTQTANNTYNSPSKANGLTYDANKESPMANQPVEQNLASPVAGQQEETKADDAKLSQKPSPQKITIKKADLVFSDTDHSTHKQDDTDQEKPKELTGTKNVTTKNNSDNSVLK